jgi:Helicase associated domain
MWTLDQLRQENVRVQTAIRNRASVLRASQSFAPVSAHMNHSARTRLAATEIDSLLNLHSQHNIQQQLQTHQHIAAIRASLLTCQAIQATSPKTKPLDAVTELLRRHDGWNGVSEPSGTPVSFHTVGSTSSRNAQLRNLSQTYHSQIPQALPSSRLLAVHSIQNQQATKRLLDTWTKSDTTHQLQSFRTHEPTVNAKARVASFAPDRKKSTIVDDKESPRKSTSKKDGKQKVTKPSKNLSKWLAMLELLKKFKEEHGHCIVPRGYEDMKLASWVRKHVPNYDVLL